MMSLLRDALSLAVICGFLFAAALWLSDLAQVPPV